LFESPGRTTSLRSASSVKPYVPAHCSPLVGAAAAQEQVRTWWNETYVSRGVAEGLVVLGEIDGELVGVAQRGRRAKVD